MARIHSKNTKPELLVRRFLFANGFRYRINCRHLPGKPDIVLKKYKSLIFINGCFWHGHYGCKNAKMPVTNSSFWFNKIKSNIIRDLKNHETLRQAGWEIVTIWECELSKKQSALTLNSLLAKLKCQ